MILAALVSPYRLDPFRSVDERGEYQQASGGVQAAAMAAAVVGGIHRLHDQKTALTHLSARICPPLFGTPLHKAISTTLPPVEVGTSRMSTERHPSTAS